MVHKGKWERSQDYVCKHPDYPQWVERTYKGAESIPKNEPLTRWNNLFYLIIVFSVVFVILLFLFLLGIAIYGSFVLVGRL